MAEEKNEKSEEKTPKPEDALDLDVDFLEDDDDFEEFLADPVEDMARISIVEPNNPRRKAEDWDDEDVDVDFDEILCKEIGLSNAESMVIDLGSQFPSLSLESNEETAMAQPEHILMQELELSDAISPKRKINKENSPLRQFSPTKRRSSSVSQKERRIQTPTNAVQRPSSARNKKNKN